MHKKIMPLLIILIISVSCLSLVSADNNTTDNVTAQSVENDLTDYIIPVYITNNGIEFSDGFTGFCLDSSKNAISVDDKFTTQSTTCNEIENHVKLAIIQCYKTGHENDIQNVVSQVIDGNKAYDIVKSVYNSTETVGDTAVVNISNDTEATFTFELLKSSDDAKSDCLAYKVSTKAIVNDDVLAASNDDANDTLETSSDNKTNDTLTAAENNNTTAGKQNINDTEKTIGAAGEENKDTNGTGKSNENNNTDGQTEINETNKTIINKTNTVIVNENNTTIINQKNIKTINKTNETPKNATLQNKIMRAVGNPIFLLVLVIVIVAVVAVVMRRKN